MALHLDWDWVAALCVALSLWLAPVPVLSDQLTRHEIFNEWQVECRSQEGRDQENCVVRSGPHVARTGQDLSGFTLSVDPGDTSIGVWSQAALGLEVKVDRGRLFSTACERPHCSFPKGEARRLIGQMKAGRVLLARIVTPSGQVVGQLPLDDFRAALAIAKRPREVFRSASVSGLDIRAMQTLLASKGYDPGPEDGVMGPRTRNAILAYQQANSLVEDGRPSRSLLFRLRAEN